jgi:hypothetical protein
MVANYTLQANFNWCSSTLWTEWVLSVDQYLLYCFYCYIHTLYKPHFITVKLKLCVHKTLTLSLCAEYYYSAASHASCPAGVLLRHSFQKLVKKKYWSYWLQVCTIRLLYVCRFSYCFPFLQAVLVRRLCSRERILAQHTVLTFDSMCVSVLSQLTQLSDEYYYCVPLLACRSNVSKRSE